ncbi:MAG: 4-phosphoerythronate dehydrogenase [Colwellia sp.]|nr:4-phosphoerythronate dehydrogenase [Colwellia sp.]MCW8863762.1 4-phosphoerythronate dehydrogenase [Colwellia sp.]MCW9081943.1 4-phosphoerythronate dehydrogenase [Colwellia sp.]
MKILFDENMPYAKEFFSDICGDSTQIQSFSGRHLTSQQVADADVLLVRSITQVNEALLSENTQLSFVGTATIGMDHIEQDYLAKRNIAFHSAPGCNAISVAEYVLSSLVVLAERYLLDLSTLSVGIVGGGNTGTRLSEKLAALGITHKICDPLLEASGHDKRAFVSLDEVLNCDVISLHVPKTTTGEHATYHLFNAQRLAQLSDKQILISACRGEVIDNQALLALKKAGHGLKLVLDVWEGEPEVLTPLIEHTEIATAHIAGYSLEGKARGTEMLYQALCRKLGKLPSIQLSHLLPKTSIADISVTEKIDQSLVNNLVKIVYDVRRDDKIFRQQLAIEGFDSLRKNYPVRREFSSVTVTISPEVYSDVPHRLGFNRA